MGKRVEKMRTVHQEAHPIDLNVCGQPDNEAGGGGDTYGAPQDEKRTVKNRPDDHFADLWAAVGRQLQGERGGDSLQDRTGEQPRNQKGDGNPKHNHADEHERGYDRLQGRNHAAGKEHGNQRDDRGQPPVAGGKIVGQNCNQPFAGGINDAAANDTGGIASEAHTNRQRLFPAGVRFFEVVV